LGRAAFVFPLYVILITCIEVAESYPRSHVTTRVVGSLKWEFPLKNRQPDSGLAIPTSQEGEDSIDCINKPMAFLSVVASRFPHSNNQLRTSSNPRNQATIQDGRVIVQQVQGRQTQCFAGTRNRGIATTSRGNYAAGQAKAKLMLAKAQEVGQILDEEQLAFIEDPGIAKVKAKEVLMANLSSCDSNVFSEVPYSNTYLNDMINQDVQEMQYFEQAHIMDFLDNAITSDSNIILYSVQESQNVGI
nr:hypothetical protein [Tanacetum cinerariifolium]